MIKTSLRFIIAIITCMIADIAAATSPIFHNLPLEQACPIYSIDQDSDGMIWLGTANGLYSFDGYRFVEHHKAYGNTLIYSLRAIDNYVVIGGKNGLSVYDRHQGQTVAMNRDIKDEVRTIVCQGGQLLIGSKKTLYSLTPHKKEVNIISHLPHDILSICPTDRGLLIGTLHGLYEITEKKCQHLDIFTSQQQSTVSALEYDQKTGRYWLGTYQRLFSYDIHTGDLKVAHGSNGMVIKSMTNTPQGLFVCSDDGLYVMKDGNVEHIQHDSRNISSLGSNVVWNVYYDSSGNILLGTDQCLSIIMQNKWGCFHSLSTMTGSNMGNDLTCMLTDSHGTIWMGGTVGLIHLTQPACWFMQNDSNYPISHNRVRDICEDSKHNIWISTDIGINLYNSHHIKMAHRMIMDALTHKEVPWIYSMLDDRNGKLWLGACDDGIYVTTPSALYEAEHICIPEKHIVKGLCSQSIRQLTLGKGNKIWVRTTKGISIIDSRTYRVSTLTKERCSLLCADHEGNMWVAHSKGIDVYSTPGRLLRTINFGTPMNNGTHVTAMLEIDGNMWIVMPTFCAIYHKGQWITNVRIPFITAHSACYDTIHKQIVIGGVDGTVTLDPQSILQQPHKHSVILSDLLVNGKLYLPQSGSLQSTAHICLDHSQNNLEFFFSDLPLQHAEMTIYAYRLKGLEKEWHYLMKTSDKIVYNSIPHGDYTLEIHAVDGLGTVGNEVYALKIDILPPWYLTLWAKIIYMLLACAIIYGGVKLYFIRKNLHKEQIARQQIMEESSARIRFYNNLSQNLHQGLSRVMSLITVLAEKDNDPLNRSDFKRLGYESTCLNAFIHQALDTGKSHAADGETALHDINIISFCDAIIQGMAEDIRKRKIKLTHHYSSASLFYRVNIIEWDSVVYTLLRSIIDYSVDGASIAANIIISDANQNFTVSLSSTIFAITEDKLPHFFQQYYDLTDDGNMCRTHDMYLIKDYAEQHNGTADVSVDDNGMTTISLTLPLDRAEERIGLKPAISVISQRDDKLLKEITSIIESNISNSDFNVTELQKEVGIGSKLLYRKVKLCTGMSPVEYIRDIRMKRAAMLLSEGRFAISEVMYMVGFSNSGYFSKCFQKAFGTTPTNFMRQH